jgi:hypothetical protein
MNQKKIILSCALLIIFTSPYVAVGEEKLGRLFFTPQQRIQLEQLENKPKGETEIIISDKIIVNGIVQRNGGSRVVWVNGIPQSRESSNGVSIERDIEPDSVPVKILGVDNTIRLKVGQSINLDSTELRNTNSGQRFKSLQQPVRKTGKVSIPSNRRMD